jgi:hypothetical protein
MERCCGFTVPEAGSFYAFYFDNALARFDIHQGTAAEVDEDWNFDESARMITIGQQTMPFLGLWGGKPLLVRDDLGTLALSNSQVQLTFPDSNVKVWKFQNFSGDWECVTFDATSNAFLYGAPYDFDFRYVELI